MGMVQELADAGQFQCLVHRRDQLLPGDPAAAGHASAIALRGFSTTSVSSIESGAGSVAVDARPALPNTDSTSGKLFRIRSVR